MRRITPTRSLGLLLLASAVLGLCSCKSQRTVGEKRSSSGSRLFDSTMGADPRDFGKRSSFDQRRTTAKEAFGRASFEGQAAEMASKTFDAHDSDLLQKQFGQRDRKVGILDERSRFQSEESTFSSKQFDQREEEVERKEAQGSWFKRWRNGEKKDYTTRTSRRVELWQGDSLPPRIIATPDSRESFEALATPEGLRQALGK